MLQGSGSFILALCREPMSVLPGVEQHFWASARTNEVCTRV